jgi:hypothetical protein
MAWRPFCKRCKRFFNGSAPSDFTGANGQRGCCPHCNTVLKMEDEDHPPKG